MKKTKSFKELLDKNFKKEVDKIKKKVKEKLKDTWMVRLFYDCNSCGKQFVVDFKVNYYQQKSSTMNIDLICPMCKADKDFKFITSIDFVTKGNFTQNFITTSNDNSSKFFV